MVSLGDLVLDVVVRAERDLARDADTPSRVTLSAGGQGANVAAWVAALGGTARWLGKRADDAAGRLAADLLGEHEVELAGPVTPDRNGIIVSLAQRDGTRSMFPDRGVAVTLRPDELEPAWLECDHLHVSGYALLAEPVAAAARRAVQLARAAGAPAFRLLVESLEPDLVFANEDEERVFGGPLPGAAWVLKRGAAGCSFDGDERAALPVDEVVDTTGAGDALAAGWIVGGPDLALEAAARCVQQVGSMPDATRLGSS